MLGFQGYRRICRPILLRFLARICKNSSEYSNFGLFPGTYGYLGAQEVEILQLCQNNLCPPFFLLLRTGSMLSAASEQLGLKRLKFCCCVKITQALQSFLLTRTGSMFSTFTSHTKKANLLSNLLCQYSSLPLIWPLYRSFSLIICSGVRFSKFFTADALAIAHTGPLLCFRNSVSPARTRPKGLCFVLNRRDSMVLRPTKIASK